MKIWHISDTHTFHGHLNVPKNVDMVIFSGDCSNPSNKYINEPEVRNFLTWYHSLDIRYKIFVAGNHDTSIEAGLVSRTTIENLNIIYLENESIEIEGINFWGTPITPAFGVGWAWNRDRGKMHELWESIPENTDVVISHGPPKGILDLSYDRNGNLENCGCTSMKKHMIKLQPKLCLFGHIHNFKDITNTGAMTIANSKTIFSNGSCVEDGRFDKMIVNHGNIITL